MNSYNQEIIDDIGICERAIIHNGEKAIQVVMTFYEPKSIEFCESIFPMRITNKKPENKPEKINKNWKADK